MNSDYNIYVADLAAYNAGTLHGVWIDATQELDDIHEAIQTMLAASPEPFSEEWAIHDYDGFGGLGLGEYEGIERVHAIAVFLEEHGELGKAVLSHWCSDIDQAQQALSDDYHGCFTSLADFAQELTEESTSIPENLAYYIDYEKMGRDLEMNDVYTVTTAYDEVHVFWNR
ncbi:antirestriction protein ArdA [Oceanobacter antarcticus]|uniref:Antirestriction protein ArdA n=1 Tax=Oceanobacter antarcticus TaxID=3133425 RepID=A0ABW8NLA6_9GAMM